MLQPEQNHKDLSGEMQTGPPETSGHLEVLSAIDSLRVDVETRFSEVDERAHRLEQSMVAGFRAVAEAFDSVHERFDAQDERLDKAIADLKNEIEEIEHRLTERLESIEIKVDGVDNRLSGVEQDVNPG